ncbi:MAG TPA: amidohydrolase family protein [Candidatus Acidoferrales bacterium]|nr:amidohydrolase family protein [Candidatus Acidoferrales bacterium]
MGPKSRARASQAKRKSKRKHYRRIATEEAFAIPEQMDAQRELVANAREYDPDLFLWRVQTDPAGPVHNSLIDLYDQRLRYMDEYDVAMHLLALTSTGVQMMDPDKGTAIAAIGNDRLHEAIQRHPDRFAGLATIAPQDPVRAVKEIDRAITKLKLSGVMINSHTNGEYLSERKYWPILEAIAGHNVPLYIHPRAPIPLMAKAYRTDHLEHAIWGYQAETGLHGLRLITGGVFDQFPKLQVVLGHMGEGIPYWLSRLDFMHGRVKIPFDRPKLKSTPSEYFKRNFYITTSGMNWEPTLKFCIEVLGADRIMWAIDYPYQDHPDAVEFMDAARISERDKQKIYHENAERVFNLPKTG